MNNDITTVLHQTAVKIFEELVFLFVLPIDDVGTEQSDPQALSMITFSGPLSGTLVMKLSTKILPELAANMLGVEEQEEISLDDQFGSLTETLNIICGNFLPELAGKNEVFNIDPPMIVSLDEVLEIQSQQTATAKVRLALEDGVCELDLFLNSLMG